MTATLPFLVEHGWWLSYCIWLLATALGTLAFLAVRRLLYAISARRHRVDSAQLRPALGHRFPLVVFVAWGVSFLSLRSCGGCIVDRERRVSRSSSFSLTDSDPLTFAAALPGNRERALEELELELEAFATRSYVALEQRVALAELLHGCGRVARLRLQHGQFEQALQRGSECDAQAVRFDALISLGRYPEAASMMSASNASLDDRVLAALATKSWTRAADLIEISGATEEAKACLSDLVRSFVSDEAARARLEATTSTTGVCHIARALQGEVVLAKVLSTLRAIGRRDPHRHAGVSVALMYGATTNDDMTYHDLLSPFSGDPHSWATRLSQDLEGFEPSGFLVVHDVLRGDFSQALGDIEELRRHSVEAQAPLEYAVRFRAGQLMDRAAMKNKLFQARAGSVHLDDPLVVSDCEVNVEDAFASATAGNGLPLVRVLEKCRPYTSALHWFLAVAPRIKTHRAELARALKLAFGEPATFKMPFDFVARLAMQRDVARALGDTAEVERLQQIIDRHLDAFATREQLAALLLWQDLYAVGRD